mmetsp:Transcript_21539/g.47357  ORF Transcript_21539/g.47357 Transcript_21539/m.47357 type:complete len:103 (+) Transcript_21539:145-453(+)
MAATALRFLLVVGAVAAGAEAALELSVLGLLPQPGVLAHRLMIDIAMLLAGALLWRELSPFLQLVGTKTLKSKPMASGSDWLRVLDEYEVFGVPCGTWSQAQ